MNTLQHMGKLLVMWLLCSGIIVKSAPDTTVVNRICSGTTYGPFDQYGISSGVVMDDLCTGTPTQGYNYYNKCFNCHGHAACSGGLTESDCGACLLEAEIHLINECGRSVGAQVQLQDCRMRFENYDFQEP